MNHEKNSIPPSTTGNRNRPLVTFALLTYNQDSYVREAILGAFSQNYSPIEILISDDSSTDKTAEILREEVNKYTGPHYINFNINSENLGIGEHVNRIFEKASGELIIFAAGDDISRPDRTERTVACWLKNHHRNIAAIYCRAHSIDAYGESVGDVKTALEDIEITTKRLIEYNRRRLLVLGACLAYDKEVYLRFGPLLSSLTVEDIPLTVRASMIGEIACLDETLVDYRVNVSVWLPRKHKLETFERHLHRMEFRIYSNWLVALQISADVAKANCNLGVSRSAQRRLCATEFAWRTCKERRFIFKKYIVVGIKSGYWRYALYPCVLFALPKFHIFLFRLKFAIEQRRIR
jgi:glycosyltransferase involved in cell wall biosynthesis